MDSLKTLLAATTKIRTCAALGCTNTFLVGPKNHQKRFCCKSCREKSKKRWTRRKLYMKSYWETYDRPRDRRID